MLAALAIAWLLLASPFVERSGAADPTLAKFLLKGGKDDLGKKQYDAALTKFERAEQEDATLVEAVFWQGNALERKADSKGAVRAYRRFVVAVEAKGRLGSLSKDEISLRKTAQERIGALALGEGERRRLDDSFVEELLAFARASSARDPATTIEALRLVLGVRPDHAEAKRLLERLGVVAAAPPKEPTPDPTAARPGAADRAAAAGPFQTVRTWNELISSKFFGSNEAAGWTYDKDLLTIDAKGGHLIRSPDDSHTGKRYAIEMECRLRESFGPVHGVGFLFGFVVSSPHKFYSLLSSGTEGVLLRQVDLEGADVLRADVGDTDPDRWHRFGAVVSAKLIEVWVDGKKRGEHEASERADLVGDLGIFQQDCRAEIRLLRWGVLP